MKNLKINTEIIKTLVGSLAFTVILSLGIRMIDKKISPPCNESSLHAHVYETANGMKKYIVCEEKYYKFMKKNASDIKLLTAKEKAKLDFIDSNALFLIDENIDVINKMIDNKKDFSEYEYTIEDRQKSLFKTSWTLDANHDNLTGKVRDYTYVYKAYKLVEDNDDYHLEESEYVKDLNAIKGEYPYIKGNFYKKLKINEYSILEDNKEKVLK